jgi:hypothetical protein
MKRSIYFILTILVGIVFSLFIGEIFVRFLQPQSSLYPRWKYSAQYGALLYENTKMVHSKPRDYNYVYTINQYGYRGKPVPISNRYDRLNLVVLGDSYSFGTGVSDGEEYPSVLGRALEPDYDVINLGVGGHGLTQEIRRFYEFGILYEPKVVLLQFCSNDPSDNIYNLVTEVRHGRFIFKDTNNPIAWIKKYLSKSIIQKSQLYNFIRGEMFRYIRSRVVVDARIQMQKATTQGNNNSTPNLIEEELYNVLLDTFARDLKRRGIRFLMISVNGQLQKFRIISKKIEMLEHEGMLEYIEVEPWFTGVTGFSSPEGHDWGKKAHEILGENLASIVLRNH